MRRQRYEFPPESAFGFSGFACKNATGNDPDETLADRSDNKETPREIPACRAPKPDRTLPSRLITFSPGDGNDGLDLLGPVRENGFSRANRTPTSTPFTKPFYSTDSRRYSLQQTNLPATPLPESERPPPGAPAYSPPYSVPQVQQRLRSPYPPSIFVT